MDVLSPFHFILVRSPERVVSWCSLCLPGRWDTRIESWTAGWREVWWESWLEGQPAAIQAAGTATASHPANCLVCANQLPFLCLCFPSGALR